MPGIRDQLLSTGVNSLAQLIGHGVRIRRSSRALPDIDNGPHKEALEHAERTLKEHPAARPTAPQDPKKRLEALFAAIVGHEGVKSILRRAIAAKAPVHVLLVGPPGSGKTQLLQAIATLPESRYATGPTISSSGLFTYLLEHPETRYLVIDEIEKAAEPDLYVLLTLMESGKLTRLQHRAIEEEKRTVWIFAAANDDSQLPQALLARFVRLELHAYSEPEAAAIIERILEKREGLSRARAREIARKVAARSKDPRDAVQIARLTRDGAPIDPVLEQVIPSSKV